MKENNKLVVFYEVEEDAYLGKYKDRGTLAFQAGYTIDLTGALYVPFESYEAQKNEFDNLAKAFGCEVLIVEAEYNVTKLDGSDFERTVRAKAVNDDIEAFFDSMLK